MEILALGANHQSAPLALREALVFDDDAMTAFLREYATERSPEGIVGISTCNRTEFYVATRDPDRARVALREAIERAKGVRLDPATGMGMYAYVDADAVAHLCRVACGVDSQVVGEDQILAQVKAAYRLALDVGSATGSLKLLFERALRVAKRARTETAIGEGNVSVASVGVSFIRKIFSDLSQKPVLVVGAGQTAELAARALIDAGARSIAFANRTPERAAALAEKLGATTADFARLDDALVSADIVICATGSPRPLITAAMLRRAMEARGRRLLAALDLSAPRNIEPAADAIDQVFVYDLDGLQEVCEENKRKRQGEARKVEAIVQEEIERFMSWVASLDAENVVRALRRRMDEIRAQEFQKYGGTFSETDRPKLDRFGQSLLNKVLHDLTVNIKLLDLESTDGLMEFDALCRALNLDPEREKSRNGDA